MASVLRHKTNPELSEKLAIFARQNKYFSLDIYKENWDKWYNENTELILEEERRLLENNYKGNVKQKLFTSARYYYSKKTFEKKQPAKRRKYCSIGKTLINAMDNHIDLHINNDLFCPSKGYEDFCVENKELFQNETNKLLQTIKNKKDIFDRIKKTYKNRYYLISKNLCKVNRDANLN